jgi:hypothetical protein
MARERDALYTVKWLSWHPLLYAFACDRMAADYLRLRDEALAEAKQQEVKPGND